MTNAFKKLAQRREELLAECGEQREQLVAVKQYTLWQLLGLLPEKGNMPDYIRRHPILWFSGALGLVAAIHKRRGIFSFISLAVLAWNGWKQVIQPFLPFLKKFFKRKS